MSNTIRRRDLLSTATPVFTRALQEHKAKMEAILKAREETRQSLRSRFGFSF